MPVKIPKTKILNLVYKVRKRVASNKWFYSKEETRKINKVLDSLIDEINLVKARTQKQ